MPDHMNSFHTNNLSQLNCYSHMNKCFSWYPCLCHATTMMRSGLESEGDPAPAPCDKKNVTYNLDCLHIRGRGRSGPETACKPKR